ncbi:MAG: NAD/FAD-utilizing enzyme [Halioglobus sp.]|nr:NAD/FAD-utilizing enzyme [Halioglobus sp.]
MKRQFYISDDLEDLEIVEQQLESAGVTTPQIHVLSQDDAGMKAHRLNDVEAVLRKDVVHGTELGAVVGVIAAAFILLIAWATGLPETITWVPPIFLSIIVLGFCTWEGGFIGIQQPNYDFKRFQDTLRAGKHVLLVDVSADQEHLLQEVICEHPKLVAAGEGHSAPGWFLRVRGRFEQLIKGTAWRTTRAHFKNK